MFHKRKFTPNNPNKYSGDPTNIIMRSSWEESLAFIKNQSKWNAAKQYAKDRGWEFIIITERELGL